MSSNNKKLNYESYIYKGMPISELESYARDMEELYYATMSSTSWKVTAPLRAIMRTFNSVTDKFRCDENNISKINIFDILQQESITLSKSNNNEIELTIPNELSVSIIIPSDNLKNITTCVEELTKSTTYSNYDIVVVTNSNTAKQLSDKFAHQNKLNICIYDKPFNFSAKCNEGAAVASGDVLCFYNDDVYPINKDWLEQMLEALSLPNIGGVNPIQMSDKNTVLNAGIVLGTPGLHTFAFNGMKYRVSGRHKPNANMIRDISALSGACLLIKKQIFNEIGKFDATNTPNSFSDIEISLRLRETGYRCVFTPYALMHHENKITWRKTDKPDKAFLYMMEKWGKYFANDLCFSDNMKVEYGIAPTSDMYKYYAPEKMAPRKPGGRDILVVSHDLLRTGAPIVLVDMVRVVLENGDWPVVVSPIDGPLRQGYLDMGVTVIIDKSIYHTIESDLFPFEYVARNFDLVVINTLAAGRAVLALHNSLPPILWWIHESSTGYNEFKHCLPDKLSDKTKAYVPSEYCANSLKNAGLLYNLGRLKFGISDYALNVEQNDNQEAVTFLMVGAIDYRKAHDVLINALNYIDKGVIKKAQFIIIGSVNDLEIHKVCMAAKDKYGNVFLHDSMPREEVLHWYSKADCLLLPSREDPLPVVAIEAMMCSLPAVCSDQTGTADYITHYENGLIFPSEDAKALAEHITYAIEQRDKMAQMGRKARTDIYEKYFTMEKFRESILNAIDEVM